MGQKKPRRSYGQGNALAILRNQKEFVPPETTPLENADSELANEIQQRVNRRQEIEA